jgi:hypothetical protein
MRRHAWNCDLSTKPGTDILTNRHIYILYIYIYPLSAHSRGHCMIRLNSPFRLSQHSPHLDDCCIQSRLGLSSGSALHLADQVQASRKGYPSQCGKNPPVLRTWRADILSEIRFAKTLFVQPNGLVFGGSDLVIHARRAGTICGMLMTKRSVGLGEGTPKNPCAIR